MKRASACALVALSFAAPASANPVVVTHYTWANGTSGLGLFAAPGTLLRIASEDLTISPDQVRIRYELANDTAAVRNEHLEFPLPEIEVGEYWFDPAREGEWHRAVPGRHTSDSLNFIGFRVSVNAKPVATEGWQRAYVWRGRIVDVTDEIKQAGLPVMMFGKTDALDRLPEAERRRLFDAHLLGTHDEDWQRGRYPRTYYPAWKVDTAFGWEQTFPAKGRVRVDITYQPMTGGSLEAVRGDELPWDVSGPCYQDWVFPDWTPWGIAHRSAVSYRETGYILTTAKYWHGPIGRFHLTVDKRKPSSVLSLCWDGALAKTGPTSYEFWAVNFTPARDIRMLVLE